MKQRQNYQEDYKRGNILRINGLQKHPTDKTWERQMYQKTTPNVSKFLEEKLKLHSINLELAHRVGPTAASYP